MLFSGLRLENYRGFEQYRLSELTRVNLIVGKNNCGKTSILEAVQILANQGDPRDFSMIARRRGETIRDKEEDAVVYPDISHLFHGRKFRLNERLRIANSDDSVSLSMELKSLADLHTSARNSTIDEIGLGADQIREQNRAALENTEGDLGIEIERSQLRPLPTKLLISQEGALINDLGRPGRWSMPKFNMGPRVQSISPESLGFDTMGRLWNRLIVEGREFEVVESLKILQPNLASIHLLTDDVSHRYTSARFLVGFEDRMQKRVPLGSFGEGMRRMLALSLSLNQAQGGILLVDEIDTGLHYSIIGEMWLLLVNAAIRYDLQVFATTHSLDCIQGLAWLCENHPELAGEVSVQKIDRRLDEAVALSSRQIRIAVEQDLEVR